MSEISEIKDGLSRILFYLENDEKTGKKGLVKEMDMLKDDVQGLRNTLTNFIAEYRQEKAVNKAKVGIIGAIGGSIVTALTWFFTHIFK